MGCLPLSGMFGIALTLCGCNRMCITVASHPGTFGNIIPVPVTLLHPWFVCTLRPAAVKRRHVDYGMWYSRIRCARDTGRSTLWQRSGHVERGRHCLHTLVRFPPILRREQHRKLRGLRP